MTKAVKSKIDAGKGRTGTSSTEAGPATKPPQLVNSECGSAPEFWDSYYFDVDHRYLTLHLCKRQPANRQKVVVPAAQWRWIAEAFEKAWAERLAQDETCDVSWETREKQARADYILEGGLRRQVELSLAGKLRPDDLERHHQEQIEAYEEIALRRAKLRTKEWNAETKEYEREPWLKEPDVQKGIRLAAEADDEDFFIKLGRALTPLKKKKRGHLPIATLLLKNWIDGAMETPGGLPLAIFSDEALADLCTIFFSRPEEKAKVSAESIRKHRERLGLCNLGASASDKNEGDARCGSEPIIKQVVLHEEQGDGGASIRCLWGRQNRDTLPGPAS